MDLTPESFELLLSWLHPDRDEAGKIYVKIREGLIRNFTSHGCWIPETLADVTIDRVVKKLPEIIDHYVGDREPYFHRVAYYVLLEWKTKLIDEVEVPADLPCVEPDAKDEELEPYYQCLDKCLAQLPSKKQDLIRKYYRGDKGAKIRQRKELAASLNIDLAALRVKALRIRQELRKCTNGCIKNPA
jgi:DNA-directed RNA polymerase specialized sigma24 family protein